MFLSLVICRSLEIANESSKKRHSFRNGKGIAKLPIGIGHRRVDKVSSAYAFWTVEVSLHSVAQKALFVMSVTFRRGYAEIPRRFALCEIAQRHSAAYCLRNRTVNTKTCQCQLGCVKRHLTSDGTELDVPSYASHIDEKIYIIFIKYTCILKQ